MGDNDTINIVETSDIDVIMHQFIQGIIYCIAQANKK
jgi:hypothetical protein